MSNPKNQSTEDGPAETLAVAAGSADMTDDPEYQAWIESMAKHCRCRSSDVPCAGVLAGGLCDDIQDDPHDDEKTPSERYDREVYGDERLPQFLSEPNTRNLTADEPSK